MSVSTRIGAAVLAASALSTFAGPAAADPVVITVPGGTLTHTIPGIATPVIGPYDVATPQITVPRACAGSVFCAGPIDIPPQTIVSVPRVSPVPLTPPITVTASTTNIVAVANPALNTLVTVPPTTILVPNPFGGGPIPIEVCPNSCQVPGAQVIDGAAGSVTISACAGATCESETVPVVYGNTNPGQICFTQATHSTVEGNSGTHGVTLGVQRIGGSFGAASASWATQPGTALASSDYYTGSGSLAWANGDNTTRSVTVSVIGDVLNEPDESFSVALSAANGATLCQPSVAQVTIINDDGVDGDPDQFLFVDRYPVSRGTMVYSNIVTITGINTTVSAVVSGSGQVARTSNGICDGSTPGWTTSINDVVAGNALCVRHTSSPDFSTSVNTTLSVGFGPGKSDTFTTTTRDEPIDECPPPGGGLCP